LRGPSAIAELLVLSSGTNHDPNPIIKATDLTDPNATNRKPHRA